MINKNNKGFTLIELLVAIVIVLSILGLAIVNLTKISKQKKQESLKSIHEQVETAALEYFSSNEYEFEAITSENDDCTDTACYGVITVDFLVKNDYLNTLTNPTTGKKLNGCDQVEIKKQGSKFTISKYKEASGKCENNTGISVSKVSIDNSKISSSGIHVYAKGTNIKKDNTWYNDSEEWKFKANFTESAITSKALFKYCSSEDKICDAENDGKVGTLIWSNDDKTITFSSEDELKEDTSKPDKLKKDKDNETNGLYICYYLKYGAETRSNCTKAKLDFTEPDCTLIANKTIVNYNDSITISTVCKDEKSLKANSGCKDSYNGKKTLNNLAKSGSSQGKYAKVYDKAGNNKTCSPIAYTVNIKAPTCSLALNGTKGNKVDGKQWYKGNVTISMTTTGSSITTKGLSTSQKSTNGKTTISQTTDTNGTTYYGYVKNAGGEGSCSITVYKDATNPTCTVTGGRNTWGNTNVTVTGTCSDSNGCKNNTVSITKSDNLINSNVSPGTVYDKVGNSTVCSSKKVMIDKIKPLATITPAGKSWENRTITISSNDTQTKTGQSGVKATYYSKNNGEYITYNNSSVTILNNTGVATVKAKVEDKAGNIYESGNTTLVCNKDIVTVDPILNSSNFKLKFSLEKSPSGIANNKYEYIIWHKEVTTDTVADANKTNYNTGATAKSKCGDFENYLSNVQIITSNQTNKTDIIKNSKGAYAMYYCLAVRPYRANRTNLTGIGNYYRSTLVQPSSKSTKNTGWTIQYKHVYGS